MPYIWPLPAFSSASQTGQRFLFPTMRHKALKIGVRIVGRKFPRYVIVNNRKQFWGNGYWTTEFRKALLYAHAVLVQHDAEKLKQKHGC